MLLLPWEYAQDTTGGWDTGGAELTASVMGWKPAQISRESNPSHVHEPQEFPGMVAFPEVWCCLLCGISRAMAN